MSEKKYQIFVSSTFDDLKDERRAVSEQILNLGHLPVGMELFHASNEDQWSHIVRRIKQCDYYIVIVAERYGSTDEEGISFTEKEYRLALAEGIPVAAFLLSDEARKLRPQALCEPRQRKRIDSFRSQCKQKLIKHWSTSADLALAVTNSLATLFIDQPRPGLVSGALASSAKTLKTLTELTDKIQQLEIERNALREQMAAYEDTKKTTELISALRKVNLQRLADRYHFTWRRVDIIEDQSNPLGYSEEYSPCEANITLLEILFRTMAHRRSNITMEDIQLVCSAITGHPLTTERKGKHSVIGFKVILSALERANLLQRVYTDQASTTTHSLFKPSHSKAKVSFASTKLADELFTTSLTAEQLLLGDYHSLLRQANSD